MLPGKSGDGDRSAITARVSMLCGLGIGEVGGDASARSFPCPLSRSLPALFAMKEKGD